jgi:integrase
LEQIINKKPRDIEFEIINIIAEMRSDLNLSFSSTHLFICAITHFFEINDVILNKKKLKKFKGENIAKFEYRAYNPDEIAKLISIMDERGKAMILLMTSSGMRVGALPDLKLKHLKKWEIHASSYHVYQITVYANTPKDKYITFCTPEAAKAIDDYLEFRSRYDHNINRDYDGNWIPGDYHLFIKNFDKQKKQSEYFINLSIKSTLSSRGIHYYVVDTLIEAGLRTKVEYVPNTFTRDDKNKKHDGLAIAAAAARHKNELHPCHSLRIFAVTNMQRSKVDKTIREMLIGHSTGLDSVYYKPQDEEILQEYLKAVDALTINNENKLKKEVKELTKKNNEKEYMLNVAMMQKDKEVEDLKKQDKIKEEALLKLSDQVMILMKEMQGIKNKEISEI